MSAAHRLRCVAAATIVAAMSTGGAGAAGVGVTSSALTVHSAAVSVPPTTCTLSSASADSYVYELAALANFGSAANLDVRAQLLNTKRAFVKFGLAPCAIPAGASILQATLGLFMFVAPTASRTYDARRVTGTWTETGITWLNQPAVAGTATASAATGTTPGVHLSWNVTSDVQAFLGGTTNEGWRVSDQVETSLTSREAQFRTAEHGTASEQPILTVTYYP